MIARAILVSLCVAQAAFAQEKPGLEELLCWFPDAVYHRIEHFDKEAYLQNCPGEIYHDYVKTGIGLLPTGEDHLPPSLVDQYYSQTSAAVGKLGFKDAGFVTEDGEWQTINRKCAYVIEANGRLYGIWVPHKWLRVYRFADLDTLVRQACERGEMEARSDGIDKRPIYDFRPKGSETQHFGFATPNQEFLVAEDLNDLKRMIRTGKSNNLPLFQILDLIDLMDVSSDPGYLWSFKSSISVLNRVLEYLYQVDPKSPSIEKLEILIDTGPRHVINQYRWDRDGNMVQLTITCYGNEDSAKEHYLRLKQHGGGQNDLIGTETYIHGRKISFKPFLRQINQARTLSGIGIVTELDGERVTTTRTDDKETLLKAMETYRLALQKREEEKAANERK